MAVKHTIAGADISARLRAALVEWFGGETDLRSVWLTETQRETIGTAATQELWAWQATFGCISPLINQINQRRDKKNITSAELADRLGLPRATVNAWLTGTKRPDPLNLERLASAVGLRSLQIREHV